MFKKLNNNLVLSFVFIYSILFLSNLFEGTPFRFYMYSLILALTALLPILACPKITKPYIILSFFTICIPHMANICHILIFGIKLDIFSMETVFDAHQNDAIEFVSNFINWKIIVFLIFSFSFYIFLMFKIDGKKNYSPRMFKIFLCASLIALTTSTYYFIKYGTSSRIKFLPLELVKQYKSYHNEREIILEIQKNRKAENFKNITSIVKKNSKETYIIVIGESANKIHQSLYGYHRPTNPNLEKMRNKLYLFNKIKSPHSHTISSLRKVLTFAYDDHLDLYYTKGSIINYFNDAGFKTFWISNKFFSGKFDNFVGILGNDARVVNFINGAEYSVRLPKYDEELIEPFRKALNDPADKKIIFINIFGSHEKYRNRYPEHHAYFSKEKVDDKRLKTINAYDDSIRYTDYILGRFLEEAMAKDEILYFLYFPDHGEDVYDTTDKVNYGHQESVGTPPMFEIPMILYLSDEYKKHRKDIINCLPNSLNKEFNIQHLIHSIIDLSGLHSEDFDKDLSIFSLQ